MNQLEQKMIEECALFLSIDAMKVDHVHKAHFEIEIGVDNLLDALAFIDSSLLSFLNSKIEIIYCNELDRNLSDKQIGILTRQSISGNKIIWVNPSTYIFPEPKDSNYMWIYSKGIGDRGMVILENFRPRFQYSVRQISKEKIIVSFDFTKIEVSRIFEVRVS
ncbi:MAG: hypothetical protein OHK0056_31210 [Bacteriovoracaceae bacterium]